MFQESTTFSLRRPLFTGDKISSVFNFDFFRAFFVSGGAGRDDDCPSSPRSSQALFFDSRIFDGDDFILVVMSVFTRIRSGATEVGELRQRAQVDLIYARGGGSDREAKEQERRSNL